MRINQEIQTILKTTWITYRKGAIAIFPRIELRELSDELKTYMENHNILYSVENHFILQKNPIKALQSLSNVELEKPVISEEELRNQFENFWQSMIPLYNKTCFIEKIIGKSWKIPVIKLK